MLWALANPNAQRTIAGYRKYNAPLPPGLIAPPLRDLEVDLWEAFTELSTEGAGVRIPWSSIRAYHDANPGIPWEVLHTIIRTLDNARAAKLAEIRENETGGKHG